MLSPAGVRELVPSLCTDEIVGGIYGWRDGYLNPRGALQGFVERSRELGATWVQDEVTGFTPHTDQGATVHTRHGGTIVTPTLIITAGAWTQRLAALAGIELPVVPASVYSPHGFSTASTTSPFATILRHRTMC